MIVVVSVSRILPRSTASRKVIDTQSFDTLCCGKSEVPFQATVQSAPMRRTAMPTLPLKLWPRLRTTLTRAGGGVSRWSTSSSSNVFGGFATRLIGKVAVVGCGRWEALACGSIGALTQAESAATNRMRRADPPSGRCPRPLNRLYMNVPELSFDLGPSLPSSDKGDATNDSTFAM